MQQEINITNLRRLLDEAKLVVATMRIILTIRLLRQFWTTTSLMMFESLLDL